MEKLDLTVTNNVIKFAKNYKAYLPKTSLPKKVLDELKRLDVNYHSGLLTFREFQNQIIDEIMRFMKTLK